MTASTRAVGIRELVRRLGSRRRATVDGARARLAVIGPPAVEDLIDALDADNTRIRAHAMRLLALIQDSRGRDPLLAMLLDRDPRVRETAAQCLARFPADATVVALERLLDGEKVSDVRIAAVRALVELYGAGQERALRQALAILCDAGEDAHLRCAALTLLPQLRASERRGLLRKLREDPSEDVALKAHELEEAKDSADDDGAEVLDCLVTELASEDYGVWNDAVHRLAAKADAAVPRLVAEMRSRAQDPEYCTRAGMVLRALGRRRSRALARALETVEEPIPLGVIVEVVGALGDKALIYRLKDLIERIAGRAATAGFDPMQRVRSRAHLQLASIGSRVAIDDLRAAIEDEDHRLDLEVIAAVEQIGKKEEIPCLLRAYLREGRFTRDRIATAVRTIMKREKIRRNSRSFRSMPETHRRALRVILPVATGGRKTVRRASEREGP